jgi:hypothetical protein
MNELIKKFERESKLEIFGLGARREIWEQALEKYAELIVKETLQVARAGVEHGPSMEEAVYTYFGFNEPKGWVCDKCGTDRTKAECPLGHMAAIEGRCPMTAKAQ